MSAPARVAPLRERSRIVGVGVHLVTREARHALVVGTVDIDPARAGMADDIRQPFLHHPEHHRLQFTVEQREAVDKSAR